MGRYDTAEMEPEVEESSSSDEGGDLNQERARRAVKGGWANARKQKAAASPFPQRLAPDADGVVIKFLEDGPYTTYRQHWIQEIREGQKAFPCLDGVDPKGCPLCDAGNRASPQFHFNVAQIEKGEPASLKTYNVGPTIFDQLSEFHTDPRQGPLEKHYWVAKRSKNGNKWTSTFYLQRREDLEEEGYQVPSQEELDKFRLWDESEVRFASRKELVEIAAKYLDLE